MNVALSPAVTASVAGLVVTFGASGFGFTVSVAAVLVAEPAEFVNTAWYSQPLWATVVFTTVNVGVVFPESVVSSVNVKPPFVETCQRTVGAGTPEAAAVNVALSPAVTASLAGLVVTTGAPGHVVGAVWVLVPAGTLVHPDWIPPYTDPTPVTPVSGALTAPLPEFWIVTWLPSM